MPENEIEKDVKSRNTLLKENSTTLYKFSVGLIS